VGNAAEGSGGKNKSMEGGGMNGEKMTLTNREVLMAAKGLQQIGNAQIEGRTSYWLARNYKNLSAWSMNQLTQFRTL